MGSMVLLLLFLSGIAAYYFGRRRADVLAGDQTVRLHSRPTYHGLYVAIWTVFPAFAALLLWAMFAPGIEDWIVDGRFSGHVRTLSEAAHRAFIRDARTLAGGVSYGEPGDQVRAAAQHYKSLFAVSSILLGIVMVALAAACGYRAYRALSAKKRTRHIVERVIKAILIACSAVAILTTIGIVLSLVFESILFFRKVPFFNFLFGFHWSPQSAFEGAGTAIEARDANANVFGVVPLIAGTLLITLIAMAVAAPVGLMSAIYLSDYASRRFRATAKPLLEVLAGIPTVVYGFFAALTVAPAIRGWGEALGLSVASESALAAGLVMGIMIIPFVSSLSDDVISAVPQSLRDGSAALGATRSETIRRIILPAALPGIVSALMLAVSRAIGETMIVVMAAGLAANLTINPLEAVTTVTVQIVTLLVGDQEFDSAKTLAAFALGLLLFTITLALNILALRVVNKYREQYD
ncbi:MAG: phosphate ABC transporter permease subunit PstC [Alphaproteobacteria bacterium]